MNTSTIGYCPKCGAPIEIRSDLSTEITPEPRFNCNCKNRNLGLPYNYEVSFTPFSTDEDAEPTGVARALSRSLIWDDDPLANSYY